MFKKLSNNRVVTLLTLSQQAFGQYKKQIVILTILGFFGGFLEGVGVNALIPLFSFALNNEDGSTDIISQMIERLFDFINIDFSVPYLLGFIIIMFTLRAIVKVYLDFVKIKITADYENQTRKKVFQHILGASWPHLLKQKLGHLETILLIDLSSSAIILREISTVIMLGTSLFVYTLVAVNISVVITLITLLLGLIIFLILKPLNYRTKKLSYGATSTNKAIAHHVNENILGVKTVKSMVASDGVRRKASILFELLRDIKIKIFVIKSMISSIIQPIGIIFISLLFAFTYQSPTFNFASLVAIVYLIQRIFIHIQQLQKSLNTMNEKMPYLRSALDYEQKAIHNVEDDNGNKPFVFSKDLEFKDVSFTYKQDDRTVFKDLNFTINKGSLVGIIGPSGVGKTTLVDLLLRLLTPSKGQILLDGVSISDLSLGQWRKSIGYVSQDIFLLNDTIANNIRFYRPDISDEQLNEVAKMANIYDFINELPKKFETVVGERGVMLSAGQRQRIVIARVLVIQPEILILDEATSSLDNESELQIKKIINRLKGRVTVLSIAHRLSTVKDADTLLVLDNGQVVEQGSPHELLKDKSSYFYKAYNLRV